MGQNVIKELTLTGAPFERGVTYGKACYKEIRRSMESYTHYFGQVGISWQQAREKAKAFIGEIEAADPGYLEEMRGIAQGAEVDFEDILAINCRTELLYAPAAPQECTAFSLIPPATAEGKVLAGQSWDYLRSQRDALVVLRYPAQDGKPSMLFFAEAGMIGGKGMNSAGLALTLNALWTPEVGKGGLPLHVRMRRILEQTTMELASIVAGTMPHPAPANLILTHRDGISLEMELECSGFDVLQPKNGRIFHTNHFVGHKFRHRVRKEANTYIRLQRMETLLGGEAVTIDQIKAALCDHAGYPYCICEHADPSRPGELQYQSATNHTVIMDLTEGIAHFALGNPCEREYITFAL